MSDHRPRFRLWVRDADRRPDPQVKQTDDRTPVIIGTALWVVALIAVLLEPVAIPESSRLPYTLTCATGVVLGPLGLLYFRLRRR